MAVTIQVPSRVELEAAYRRAQQAEHAAARKLVDQHFDDEHYAQFIEAAEEVLILRGQLHTNAVWTQDGKIALLDDWCNCTIQTESALYQRFNDVGQMVGHGVICGRCRHVAQVG